jgi:hypothetical protein
VSPLRQANAWLSCALRVYTSKLLPATQAAVTVQPDASKVFTTPNRPTRQSSTLLLWSPHGLRDFQG